MTASLNMIRGRSNIVTLTNNSGGALAAGDVCIQDTSADEKVTTTTSAASVLKVFVAAESIASGAAGRFYESGYCPLVNVSASVTRGRFLFTHTVAKQAAENATYAAGAFGKILKSGTTPSAIIYSATAQSSGSGVTRSGSTTGDHLAVWDGSNADSIKDGGAVPSVGSTNTIPAIDAAATASVGSGDLFAGTSLDGGWSSLQSTALTSNDRSSANWLINKNTGNTGGKDRGLQRAFSPAGDFTVYAKIGSVYKLTTNYTWAGIFIGAADPSDGASGNRLDLMIVYNGGIRLKFAKYAAGGESNVFDNDVTNIGLGSLASTAYLPRPFYLLIKRASTTLTASVSWDGVYWDDQSTTTTIAFAVGTIGVFQGESSSNNGSVVTYNFIATTG